MTSVRLTELAHGGGCGCKLAPSVLRQLLAGKPSAMPFAQLLVGTESSDDAAVWQVDERTCVIATTDFFMPVVDDPYDFGRIAAANALSDVYAMGGKPIMALAILGMPWTSWISTPSVPFSRAANPSARKRASLSRAVIRSTRPNRSTASRRSSCARPPTCAGTRARKRATC